MPETRDLVRLLGTRFIQRRDVKSFQANDGAWYPKREPMTMADFEAHLAGTSTMGHYLLDEENNTKLFAFDIDLVKHGRQCPGQGCQGCPVRVIGDDGKEYDVIPRQLWPEEHPCTPVLTRDLRSMADGLAWTIFEQLKIPVAIASSGHKGLHVYGFTGTITAKAARELALDMLRCYSSVLVPFRGENFFRHEHDYQSIDIEVFPKQTSLDGKDLGNLMSLPLGIHRVTGRRKFFISSKGRLDTLYEIPADEALDGTLPWD